MDTTSRTFESLVREHNSHLCGYAAGIVGSNAIAEELVQDVWLKFWERRESIIVEQDVRGYLFRAVRNEAMTWLRRAKLEQGIDPDDVSSISQNNSAQENAELSELQIAAKLAIAKLPLRMREAFLLRRRGLSYEEVGEVMGVSSGTARQQVIAAVKKLELELSDWINP